VNYSQTKFEIQPLETKLFKCQESMLEQSQQGTIDMPRRSQLFSGLGLLDIVKTGVTFLACWSNLVKTVPALTLGIQVSECLGPNLGLALVTFGQCWIPRDYKIAIFTMSLLPFWRCDTQHDGIKYNDTQNLYFVVTSVVILSVTAPTFSHFKLKMEKLFLVVSVARWKKKMFVMINC